MTNTSPLPPGGRRQLPSAIAVAMVAVILASWFVSLRVEAVGWDGFVAAGSVTAEGSSVFTYDHYGYDGQFFYRLALEPFSTAERVDGIAFDAPAYRQQRIGYPLVAHALATATPLSTVQSLVVTNLLAVGAVALFAARIAQSRGRKAAVALLIFAWPAFIFSLGLDLSEIVAAAFVLGGVYLASTGRHTQAAIALCGGVLTRETAVLVALMALWTYRKSAYAAPAVVLVAWQGVVWSMWGAIPGVSSLPAPGERLLGFPFVGLIQGAGRWSIVDTAVFVALTVLLWIGLRHLRLRSLEGRAFAVYAALPLCLGWPVWESWRGFARATVELVAMVYILRFNGDEASPISSADAADPSVSGSSP